MMKMFLEVSTSNKSRKFKDLMSAIACFDLLADYSGYVIDIIEVIDALDEKDIYSIDTCTIRVVYAPEVENEK